MARSVAALRLVDADVVDDGRSVVDRQRYLPYASNFVSAVVLDQRTDHDVDPARPRDRGQRERQERFRSVGSPHRALRCCRALCMGNGLDTRTLAQFEAAWAALRSCVNEEDT